MQLPDATAEFHLKEFEALRVEIDEMLKEARTLERWVLVSVGAVMVWLYSNPELTPPAVVYWIPFLLAFVCAFRVLNYQANADYAAAYLRKLEQVFRDNGGPEGWNHYVGRARWFKYSIPSLFFWCFLVGSTFIFGLVH